MSQKHDSTNTVYVHEHRVGCDGGGGALGHPLTYYTLHNGKAVCKYCNTVFVLHDSANGGAH